MTTRPVIPSTPSDTHNLGRIVDLSGAPIEMGLKSAGPIVLLPVRIETRFVGASRRVRPQEQFALLVRIFPDQIAIDSHDPSLTKNEWVQAVRYWGTMWKLRPTDVNEQRAAWSELASAFGPRRAAYVAQATAPPGFDSWIASQPATTLGQGKPFQPKPPQGLRDTSWEMTPMARALPVRWLVALYSGGVVNCMLVDRPKKDLAASLAPPPDNDPNPPKPDAAMQWMVDFQAAEDAGMAVRIPLSEDQANNGFDQVVVVGISEADATVGAKTLESLLTAHRFTDGFAFVPQGTPTKNSSDAKSGYSRKDDTYAASFATERQAPLIDTGASSPETLRDGHFFADSLGVSRSVLTHISNSNGLDQQDAIHMMNVLWPVTGGYAIPYILGYRKIPLPELRQFAISFVRCRGPLPAFRVGTVPYGVLPVMSIAQSVENAPWAPLFLPLAKLINSALPHWLNCVTNPATTASPADGPLPAVLRVEASTCRINAGLCFGPYLEWNMSLFDSGDLDAALGRLGDVYSQAYSSSVSAAAAQFARLGWLSGTGHLSGLVMQMLYAYNLRLVTTDNVVSETDPLPYSYGPKENYLQYFETKTVTQLLKSGYTGGAITLLFRLLLQSVLLEYASVAGTVLNIPLVEPEFFLKKRLAQPLRTFVWALENSKFPIEAGAPPANGLTLGDYIHAQLATAEGKKRYPTLASIFASLRALAPRPTAALERAFTETLDTWAYRLDAWWTSLATCAVAHYRSATPSGIFVGVYGYVENLRPAAPPGYLDPGELKFLKGGKLVDLGRGLSEPFAPKEDNSGFVYAPSLAQAITAAVLRNGYLVNRGGRNTPELSIDLSSARVRKALDLMEGINHGQHLGALLGYQFEMNLIQNNLAKYVGPFRNLYPIVANKLTGSGPADSVAASNVVDGAALQQAWVAGTIPWGGDLPKVGSDDYKKLSNPLDLLNDAVDAVSDLAVAETIFQVVRGNPVRAGGALDASSRDQHVPPAQVIETPRGGLDFTQRLLSMFPVDPDKPPSSSWLGTILTPRAAAEPFLERWLTSVLPDPSRVQFQIRFTPPKSGATPTTLTLALDKVGISTLDLVAMTPAPPDPASKPLSGTEMAGSELERRILAQCAMTTRSVPVGATNISLAYGRDTLPHAPVVLPELFMLTRALKELLGAARPLTPVDLVPPKSQSDLPPVDMAQLSARIKAASDRFSNLVNTLGQKVDAIATKSKAKPPVAPTADDANAITPLLLDATSFGDPGAAPLTIARDTDSIASLINQVTVVRSRLDRRWKEMHDDLFDAHGKSVLTHGANLPVVQRAAQDLFGKDFTILPTYTPISGDSLDTSLADTSKARTAWRALSPENRLNAAMVMQQMTHLHPAAARTDYVMNLAAAMQSRAHGGAVAVADLEVAQLPYDHGLPWLGDRIPAGQFPWDRAMHGKCALLLWMPAALANASARSVCGLKFDEWVERIPNDTERTAVAFHYEEPTARAPETLLLAVTPPGKTWSAQLLFDTVRETVNFAKARTVDPESLRDIGQLVPALYCAYNAAGLTISTDFVGLSSPESL